MKRKSIFNLILTLLVSVFSLSQSDSLKPKTHNYAIEANLTAYYGSSNLTNEFIKKLLFGGELTSSLKDKVLNKTNKRNRIGLEVNYKTRFIDLTDTLFYKLPNYNYYIEFSSYNNISTSYTKDLFSTVFYGNKQFENQIAKLGKSNFTSYKFEKITFGLIKDDWSQSFGISLIIGNRFNGYNIKKADMFTHPNGTQIDMNYEGKLRISDPERGNFLTFNGAGLGLDYSTLLFNNKYRLTITNVGFAVWQQNTSYSNTSVSYKFEGIEIDNVLKTSSDEIKEKVKEILPELHNKGFITMLPTIIRFDKNFDKEKKFQSIYGIRYKFFSNYLPSLYAGGSYQVNNSFRILGNLAWGGYSGLRVGLGLYYKRKNFTGGLETSNLTGIVLKDGNGNGASIFASYYF